MRSLRRNFPHLSPITWRKFSEIQARLDSGEVAFLIGAGIDRQLAKVACWADLLDGLIRETPHFRATGRPSSFADISARFPAEVGYLARWNLGDVRFTEKLSRAVNPHSAIPQPSFVSVLTQLLFNSNLIVTTNYSSVLQTALERSLGARTLVVRDREELSTLDFPTPRPRPHEILLVHIHGRCSDRSLPILDAWGYSIARDDSDDYTSFLRRLFSERFVVTIGCSWEDAPLRDAAAFVKRKMFYFNRAHLAFLFQQRRRSRELEVGFKNAMRGALGVEVIPVDEDTQQAALESLSPLAVTDYPRLNDLAGIAEFLDNAGDYDCELQHGWLRHLARIHSIAPINEIASIRKVLDELQDRILDKLLPNVDGRVWLTAAKIERHLRHHRYLYFKANNARRQDLWLKLAATFKAAYLPRRNSRLLFDFLVGSIELAVPHGAKLNRITRQFQIKSLLFKKRLRLAREVWGGGLRSTFLRNEMQLLEDRLLDVGWESMAAKVCGDKVAFEAEAAAKGESRRAIVRILDESERAEGLARLAGSFWRHFKPSVLHAFWNPNSAQARLALLGKINAARNVADPMLLSGLVAGLVVCELKLLARRAKVPNGRQLWKHLTAMLTESSLKELHLREALNGYWNKYMPKDIRKQVREIRKAVITSA